MPGPLTGVRVLDFSEYIAGPYAGQLLADLGAEVTKVEPPHGDFWRLTNSIAPGESRGFIGVNRGKRSVSIDLKQPESQEVLHRAVKQADVLLQNYRPGVAERIGLDYPTLSKVNPRLVYCVNTAFGTTGPYAGRPGFDLLAQAMTGIMANEGGTGLPRNVLTAAITDLSSGMFMAYSVVAALYQREHTGRGQLIETSLFNTGLAIQYRPLLSIESMDKDDREGLLAELKVAAAQGKTYEEVIGSRVFSHPGGGAGPYYTVYQARDGYVVIACLNNRLRRISRDLIGVDDPRVDGPEFDLAAVSSQRAHEISAEIQGVMLTKAVAEWVEIFDGAGVPCGPVNLPVQLFDDPHVKANNLVVDLDHPIVGKIRMASGPLKMDGVQQVATTASPALGQHSRAYLHELGFSGEEIETLEAKGVVNSWEGA